MKQGKYNAPLTFRETSVMCDKVEELKEHSGFSAYPDRSFVALGRFHDFLEPYFLHLEIEVEVMSRSQVRK